MSFKPKNAAVLLHHEVQIGRKFWGQKPQAYWQLFGSKMSKESSKKKIDEIAATEKGIQSLPNVKYSA